MKVFYSFHYERDVNRVQLIRNMGMLEGQRLLNAQEWETVRRQGTSSIEHWINEQMKYKTAVIVLIGKETASRPWVQYEIQRAWELKKPLLGIQIHGLSAMGTTDSPGQDPFTKITGYEGRNPGIPIFDPTVTDIHGRIDSRATYSKLASNLYSWSTQGRIRRTQ